VTTVHDTVKESGRVLPHPSVVFHTYASMDTPWVARTLSHCTPVKRGKVSSNSAPHDATQFAGLHESRMCQYTTQSLLIRIQPTQALIDSGGSYALELQIYDLDHSPPYHLVFYTSPSCPTKSQIMPTY
jgi:hypothetical protein